MDAVGKIQSLINKASQSGLRNERVFIYLHPGTHLDLGGSHIECSAPIQLRVRSSGAGATLDGGGRSRIFYLTGDCSLELEGLRLVNGRTQRTDDRDDGGAVYSKHSAGSFSMTRCTIANCSTNWGVRRPTERRPAAPLQLMPMPGVSQDGGAIAMDGPEDDVCRAGQCRVNVTLSSISHCSSANKGGALRLFEVGDVLVASTTFSKCSAPNVSCACRKEPPDPPSDRP